MSQKTDDCLTAAICPDCHNAVDNGKELSRDERRALIDKAICLTVAELARLGLIKPA